MLRLVPITAHVGFRHAIGRPNQYGIPQLNQRAKGFERRTCEVVCLGSASVVFEPLVSGVDNARRKASTVLVRRAREVLGRIAAVFDVLVGNLDWIGIVVAHAVKGNRQRHDFASGWQQVVLVNVFDIGGIARRIADKLYHALVADVITSDLEALEPFRLLEQAAETQLIGSIFVCLALLHLCKRSLPRNARPGSFKQ